MTEIDWSKAPEWATALLKHAIDESYVWAASHSDGVKAQHVSDSSVQYRLMAKCWVLLEDRPTTPQWSGEGLPPVGVECEYQRNDVIYKQAWVAVTPRYIGEPVTVLKHSASGNEFTEMTASCVFRPIRTPEQIAADEREAAIYKMLTDTGRDYTCFMATEIYADLYDAGYKKPNA